MTITATDVISEDEVRAVLEERTQEMYQFRRAFRPHDATGLNSGKFTFPQASNDLRDAMAEVDENPDEIGEPGAYQRHTLEHEGIDATYTKEGFEVAISDEAADDTPVDVILDITEEMGIAAEARLDFNAYTVLENNHDATEIGDAADPVNFEAIVDAYVALVDNEMNPANFEAYASPTAWGELAKDDRFNRATDDGDALARSGMLAEVFGADVALTNTGNLGSNEIIMVDTGRYGYESTRWNRDVTTYRDEEHDRDVFKIRHRMDFVPMRDDAAVKIVGGVVEAEEGGT